MEYKKEMNSLYDFEFWSGAKDRIEEIKELNLEDEFFSYLEEIFADSTPSETDINDFVWFECDEWIEEHKEQEEEDL